MRYSSTPTSIPSHFFYTIEDIKSIFDIHLIGKMKSMIPTNSSTELMIQSMYININSSNILTIINS